MRKEYQADPIVYNELSEYGGNQVSPHKTLGENPYEREELQMVVKSHFPSMQDEDIKNLLYRLDREGCGYVSMINSLFDEYAEKPDAFREIFGFSIFNADGTLDYNRVLVDLYCKMDNHNEEQFGLFSWDTYNPTEDQKKEDTDKDGVYEWVSKPCGNNQKKMKYRWETYCKSYGIKADVQIEVPVTPKNYMKYATKGSVSILCSDFTMYKENGASTHVKNGHFMTITDVTEDGRYIVSSWGEKYYLNPKDIKGFMHYQVIRYKRGGTNKKKHKNIMIVCITLVISIVTLFIMWDQLWQHYATATELGYQTHVPVAKATKPITLQDGHQSTAYYVVLEVETSVGARRIYIDFDTAYENDDLLYGLEAYRNKKKIKGYFFFSEALNEVCFSREISTADELWKQKAKPVIILVLAINAFIILQVFFMWLTGLSKLPEIPQGNWQEADLLVCKYNTWSFSMAMLLCLFMTMMGPSLAPFLWKEGTYLPAVILLVLSFIFFLLAMLFAFWMRNYVIVFYPKGIVYRDVFGKVRCYTDEQIQSVSVIDAYRNHSMRIQTHDKNIWLNSYCSNYDRAKAFAVKFQ